jgi:flagellar L-ring protein FlgH
MTAAKIATNANASPKRSQLKAMPNTSIQSSQGVVCMAGVALATLLLAACDTPERLSRIGKAPDLSPIEDPTARPEYQPVRMPMPTPRQPEMNSNSLWQPGATAFFDDQRASRVGDILTVSINIDDAAAISNQTSRSRSGSESAGAPNLFGLEDQLEELDLAQLIQLSSESGNTGSGAVQRNEEINMDIAAVVTDVLPNGNLVLFGRQEVRVNFEVRELAIAGIIRPMDITSANSVGYEKIAEARISYGGRGQITDVQQPRYGQQLYDIIFPF